MNPDDTDTFLGFFALDWKEMVVMEETGRIKMASEPDSPPDSKHLPIQASKLPLLQQLINSLLGPIWRAGQACGEAQRWISYSGNMAKGNKMAQERDREEKFSGVAILN